MALTVDATRNPIKVTGTTAADQEIYGNPIYIKFIHWLKPTTVGHLLTLKDGSGNDIGSFYCDTVDESQIHPIFSKFDSIRCDDMDSGTLYIYHPG